MTKSIAKTRNKFNGKILIMSVDVGKDLNFGYGRIPNGEDMKIFSFANTYAGYTDFLAKAIAFKEAHGLESIKVGLESTGVYGGPFIYFLHERDIQTVLVNPFHTKRLKELEGNSPNKTDKKDPKVIASIVELGHYLKVVLPEGVSAELRSLAHARERCLVRCNSLVNQLHDLTYYLFPEFLTVMKDVTLKSSRYLLEKMPLPTDIVTYGIESLTGILRKVSHGKLGEERAKALYASAIHSVGVREGQSSIVFEIHMILRMLQAQYDIIEELEEKMADNLKQIPYATSLLSLKGAGEVTVAGLVGEFGDFTQFRTQREVLKFVGFDLYEISSGRHKGQRHISKRGRSLARKLLYFSAINTVRKNGIMRAYYEQHLKTGMKKNKALIAVARKLLGIMFALVRENTLYVENYQASQYRKAA